MNLILIRHGEIDSNVAKVYSGRSSEPLNSKGRVQAEQAAEQLSGQQLKVLVTSPLRRAVETASIIGGRLGLCPQVSSYFNELRMGPWDGLSEAEVETRYPAEFSVWNSRPADLHLKGRETLEELRKRVVEGLVEVQARYGNITVAIVSHVAVIRVLMLMAERRPLNDYKEMFVPNATPIVLCLNPAIPGSIL